MCKGVQQNTYLMILPHHISQNYDNSRCPLCTYRIHRCSDYVKLVHPRTTSALYHHFYLSRLWNCLPVINLTLPAYIIKQKIKSYLSEHFNSYFHPDQILCSFQLLCPCYRCSRQLVYLNKF